MIAIAHALGMRVVAEGSESRRQMQLLQTLGCDEEQGFYFFAPGGARSAPGAAGPGLGGMSALSCSSCRRLFQRPGSLRRRPVKAIIPAPAASKARVPGSGTSAGSEPVNFCK
ncbi:putative GGDEF domain protein [Massilia sp. LC238]|nr:putative GGDEF domain protein [Massilia sp. LC238]